MVARRGSDGQLVAILRAAPDVNEESVAVVADGIQSACCAYVSSISAERSKDALHNARTLPHMPCAYESHPIQTDTNCAPVLYIGCHIDTSEDPAKWRHTRGCQSYQVVDGEQPQDIFPNDHRVGAGQRADSAVQCGLSACQSI